MQNSHGFPISSRNNSQKVSFEPFQFWHGITYEGPKTHLLQVLIQEDANLSTKDLPVPIFFSQNVPFKPLQLFNF